jgi:hypothetical protein
MTQQISLQDKWLKIIQQWQATNLSATAFWKRHYLD